MTVEARLFRGSQRIDAIAADDRGLAYGDGLFETMRVHAGDVPWADAHWQRLATGALRLGIPLPPRALVFAQLHAMFAGDAGIAKLIVSRIATVRGYAPGDAADAHWMLQRHDLPSPAPTAGLALIWCDLRLSTQRRLAGIKHCNRLEQVLARAEWTDPAIDDGLLRDADGNLVCATAANVFVLHGAQWTTPPLDRCGVAGVCRGWLLDALQARVADLDVARVEWADALLLCNAVRGILPVASLGPMRWQPHPAVALIARQLGAAHPGFAATTTIRESP